MSRLRIILLLCILSCQTVSAQVQLFDETVEKKECPKGLPYDSLSNMRLQEFGTLDNYKFTFDHLIGQTLMFCGDPYSYMGNRDFKVGGYYKVTGTLPDDVRKGLYCRMILRDVETGEKKRRG